jgi:hypothetical protein
LFEVAVDVRWRYRQGLGNSGTQKETIDFDPFYAALANRDVVPGSVSNSVEMRREKREA